MNNNIIMLPGIPCSLQNYSLLLYNKKILKLPEFILPIFTLIQLRSLTSRVYFRFGKLAHSSRLFLDSTCDAAYSTQNIFPRGRSEEICARWQWVKRWFSDRPTRIFQMTSLRQARDGRL